MEQDSVKNIMNTIKKERITPQSVFRIRWKSYVFWCVWGCVMLIGAVSFSLLIVNLLDIRPAFFHYYGIGRYVRVLFSTAPYLWLFLAVIALMSGIFAMRKTYRGYRYSVLFIASISVLVIMIIGSVVHVAKMNDRIGQGLMGSGLPRMMVFPGEERLQQPNHGMLGGRVIDVSEDHFDIIDFDAKEWSIFHDAYTRIDSPLPIETGSIIGVVGEENDGRTFHADMIKLLPGRMLQQMQNSEMRHGGERLPEDRFQHNKNRPMDHMRSSE